MPDITHFKVSGHFLAYFINGDLTGFSDEDEQKALAFEARETEGMTKFHWAYDDGDGGDFGTCEITGLGADLATLQLVNMAAAEVGA